MPSATAPLEGVAVAKAEFAKLARIPIVIYFGDNIPKHPSKDFGEDNWRVRLAMAKLWTEAIKLGRRRRNAGAPAGDRHPRQYALPILRPEQRADR